MDLVKTLSAQYMKPELPEMNVGDTVRVVVKVKEGSRERTQAFEGTIIARKHGGINETITVRRISYGVGCEKVFPVHSPSIVSVAVKVKFAEQSFITCAIASARRQRSKSACKVPIRHLPHGRVPVYLIPGCFPVTHRRYLP